MNERMAVEGKDEVGLMTLLVTFLSVFVIVYIVYVGVRDWTSKRRRRGTDLLRSPPSMASVPVLGSIVFMTSCKGLFHRFFADKAKTLGPVFTCYLGSKMTVVLNDRKSIQEALIKRSNHFSGRHAYYTIEFIYNTQLKGITSRQYDARFRKAHQQTMNILKEFGLGQQIMEGRILCEVDELISHIGERHGEALDPKELVTLCTLNVVASILFGRRLAQTDPALKDLAANVFNFLHVDKHPVNYCPPLRFVPYYRRRIEAGADYLGGVFRFVRDGIRSSLENGSSDSYVKSHVEKEEGGTYDEEELKFICRDFIEAGTDTTSMTILWSLVELANNPAIQKRLHEEIDSVLPGDRSPVMSDLTRMPYVEATILEVLRYKSPLPLALAHKTHGPTQVAEYYVPDGIMVLPNLFAVHMDKETWGDPDVFRPERFLDESGEHVVGKNRVIAFSMGRRSCLGEGIARQELFLMLVSILRRFEVQPPENERRVECVEMPGVIISPSPFRVRFMPRDTSL